MHKSLSNDTRLERDSGVTELCGANLSGADLKGANLKGAIMPDGTVHG